MEDHLLGRLSQWLPFRVAGAACCGVLVFIGLSACTHTDVAVPTVDTDDYTTIATQLRAHYDAILPQLPWSQQRHYAQRLYRLTGDARYLPINREYEQRLLDRIHEEIESLSTPGYARERSHELVQDYYAHTTKQQQRKQMLSRWGQMAYARDLVFYLAEAHSQGALNESMLPGYQRALAYLAGIDFRRFLLDADVMATYAAQVANLTYYLYELDIVDLRQEVVAAFRRQYPPHRDAQLSDTEYRNKIYGMTHLVIAASGYYEQTVSANEFAWVLEEFSANLSQILARTKEDVYSEVGISFLLAGQGESPALARIREAVAAAYNPVARMIPAEDGNTDVANGEHRNVLAIMLFDWPAELHPIPQRLTRQ